MKFVSIWHIKIPLVHFINFIMIEGLQFFIGQNNNKKKILSTQ